MRSVRFWEKIITGFIRDFHHVSKWWMIISNSQIFNYLMPSQRKSCTPYAQEFTFLQVQPMKKLTTLRYEFLISSYRLLVPSSRVSRLVNIIKYIYFIIRVCKRKATVLAQLEDFKARMKVIQETSWLNTTTVRDRPFNFLDCIIISYSEVVMLFNGLKWTCTRLSKRMGRPHENCEFLSIKCSPFDLLHGA